MQNFFISFLSFFPWYVLYKTSLSYSYAPLVYVGLSLVVVILATVVLNLVGENRTVTFMGRNICLRSLFISAYLVLGIDYNIGLFVTNYFIDTVVYVSIVIALLIFALSILVLYFLIKTNAKNLTIICLGLAAFYFSGTINNIIRVYSPYFTELKQDEMTIPQGTQPNKSIVVFLDALSGLPFVDTSVDIGRQAEKAILDLVSEFDFSLYENAYSVFNSTSLSIPSSVNFLTDPKITPKAQMVGFYGGNHVLHNKLFDLYPPNSVSVYQDGNVDMCLHENVAKCDWHRSFSFYQVNQNDYSILVRVWRVFATIFNIELKPEEMLDTKIRFDKHLTDMTNDLIRGESSLYFSHFAATHDPSIYLPDCKISPSPIFHDSARETILQFYQEMVCVLNETRNLLVKLREAGKLNDYTIILLGDHGARLSDPTDFKSDFSTISHFATFYAVRKPGGQHSVDKEIVSTNQLLRRHLLNLPPVLKDPVPSYFRVTDPELHENYYSEIHPAQSISRLNGGRLTLPVD